MVNGAGGANRFRNGGAVLENPPGNIGFARVYGDFLEYLRGCSGFSGNAQAFFAMVKHQ